MLRHRSQHQLVWGHKTPNIEHKLQEIVPWVLQAGRPFYNIFLHGADPETTIHRWLTRRSSELSLQRLRLLISDDRIVGGYISLSGRDLPGSRQADLLDLARSMGPDSYPQLRDRMEDLRDLFAPVEENDFYLSKLGLLPQHQSPSLRQALLDDCIRRARQGSFRRVRVDVPEQDRTLRDFYGGQGFEAFYRGKAPTSNLKYLSMAFDL